MADVARLFAEILDEEAESETMPADEPLMGEALRIAESTSSMREHVIYAGSRHL